MQLANAKILITGAGGMLGHALQAEFAEYQPILADRPDIDITDAQAVEAFVSQHAPTHIINAAAYTQVDQCETEREACFQVNAQGIANLARAAHINRATLVHYSTDYVFAGDDGAGYREDADPNPLNAYGESKLAGEQALADSGANFYLIRTSWLFGPHGKNFVDTMRQLSVTKPELRVINDQTGSPTYTVDLAAATHALLKSHPAYGIYHFTNSGQTTWYEFARETLKLSGSATPVRPITTADYPTPAKRPKYSTLLNTKFQPLRPWPEALATYIKSYPALTNTK